MEVWGDELRHKGTSDELQVNMKDEVWFEEMIHG